MRATRARQGRANGLTACAPRSIGARYTANPRFPAESIMMLPASAQLVRRTTLIIVGLMLFRLVAAATTPLTFDEAYYWTWSRNLAGGFYDHPPAVAMVIGLGTLIAGDTELGVAGFNSAGAADELGSLSHRGDIVREPDVGLDRGDPAERDDDGVV